MVEKETEQEVVRKINNLIDTMPKDKVKNKEILERNTLSYQLKFLGLCYLDKISPETYKRLQTALELMPE